MDPPPIFLIVFNSSSSSFQYPKIHSIIESHYNMENISPIWEPTDYLTTKSKTLVLKSKITCGGYGGWCNLCCMELSKTTQEYPCWPNHNTSTSNINIHVLWTRWRWRKRKTRRKNEYPLRRRRVAKRKKKSCPRVADGCCFRSKLLKI